MLSFLLLCFAFWLFVKFVGALLKLSWGLMKGVMGLFALLIWPIAIILILAIGLTKACLPIILICCIAYFIGKASSGGNG